MPNDPGAILGSFLAGRTARATPTRGRALPFGGVEVVGLTELQRALRDIEPQLKKEFNKELRNIGNRIVTQVKAKVPVETGRTRASIKSGVRNGVAYVQGGKTTVPYYPWLEYGGKLKPTGGRHNLIVRERIPEGRYLYPTVEAMRPEIQKSAEEAFEKTARKLGLK